ncbi:MAG TPA: gliding motility-associated C-terminal domain-containing protein, partial [Bacteroidia bacterium]|nr:gliding motility-associated C-terminal domain-containing protein [Bacteroidia bacterium]
VQSYGQLNNVYVMKMDATTGIVTGGPLVIFGTGDEWAADALPANNSPQKGVYLVGSTNSYGAGSNDIFMARIDSTCGLTWFKTYGGLQSDDPSQIIQLADGNMLVTGTTASYGAGATDMFLMKVDPAGNMIWFKTYGCTGIEYGASVLQLPSSNLALLGTTFSYGAGDADVFLMVTPAEDSVTCNMQFFTPVVLTHFPTIQVGGNEASANTPATVATPTTLTFNFTPGTICSPPLIVTATATPDCTSGTATASVTGGNSPYNYLWSSGQTTAVVPNLAAGTYTVTVTGSVGACVFRTDSDSATVTVNYNPVPVAVISSNAINGSFYFSGQNAELCFSETGSTGYDTLSWFINGVPTGATSCVTINDSTVGPVCATLYVVNTFGCPDTATICAEIIHSDYTIPNIFTPNGDATNDAFIISTNGIKELHCDIYDRWGVLIYSWDGITGKWDGKSLNGEFVSDGVYYFTARLADYQEKVYNENGFVQLIRAK